MLLPISQARRGKCFQSHEIRQKRPPELFIGNVHMIIGFQWLGLVFASLIINNLSLALYVSIPRLLDDILWLITSASFPIINIFYSWKILRKSLPQPWVHRYRFACGLDLKLSMAAYLCIINLMNKMFLKAISAHIRGLIKPNRVELWLILSQEYYLINQVRRSSVAASWHQLPQMERGSSVKLHPPQMSANQRPVFVMLTNEKPLSGVI